MLCYQTAPQSAAPGKQGDRHGKSTREGRKAEAPKKNTEKEQAALDKLSRAGGSHTQWDAAWLAYKEAAGL